MTLPVGSDTSRQLDADKTSLVVLSRDQEWVPFELLEIVYLSERAVSRQCGCNLPNLRLAVLPRAVSEPFLGGHHTWYGQLKPSPARK